MGRREFKKPPINQGKKIGVSSRQTNQDSTIDYPIFCFKHLDMSFGLSKCNKNEKSALVEQLTRLSQLTWNQIKLEPKHGMGSEKISKTSIRASIPNFISDDVDFFLAFRFSGKAPFVGHRNGSIFHVLYIDPKFDLYDHGG